MKQIEFTAVHEQCLRDQIITDEQPGPVLRDFQMLLDYLGNDGVVAGGKYNLLPLKSIEELDPRLSQPLRLKLKRPQLRSHPYLQGLNLLLRATGLVRVEGAGGKARLMIDPAMLIQWNQLDPTERYFTLLEAWLRIGNATMIGEQDSIMQDILFSCIRAWQLIPAKGRRFDLDKPEAVHMPGIYGTWYQVALMDLFGRVEVEQPPEPVAPWRPARVKHRPFGDAVFSLLIKAYFSYVEEEHEFQEEEEETPDEPLFGAWLPLFQPYFPELQRTLELPEPEFREGEFVFRVSLGKIWRLIAIPAEATLEDLADVILQSVNFDSDHLYEFTFQNRLGAKVAVSHPEVEEGPWTDEVQIGALPLEPGRTMGFRFDFGDNWEFTVRLERIDPPAAAGKAKGKGRSKGPRILERHGSSPKQYHSDW